MELGIWAYPWDVNDDPRAADEIADLRPTVVSLAAVYHATRLLLPHNPRHTVVTVEDAATYFHPDASRYTELRLQPNEPAWLEPDAFGTAATALHAKGLRVNAWVVMLHNSRLGRANVDLVIQNCVGDRYTHALCPSQPDVRRYAETLVADLCSHYRLDGIELEACGFMGFEHLTHHEKSAVVCDQVTDYLLSICFCPACEKSMSDYGLVATELRRRFASALKSRMATASAPIDEIDDATEVLQQLVGDDLERLQFFRSKTNEKFVQGVLAAADPFRPSSVIVNTAASPYRNGAGIYVEPEMLSRLVDGLLVSVWTPSLETAVGTVRRFRTSAKASARVIAGVRAFPPDVSDAADLAERCWQLARAGASGLRFYNYGLCTASHLEWIQTAMCRVGNWKGA